MERPAPAIRMLNAKDLALVLGSRALAYRLLNMEDFPTVRLGKRLLVRQDSFDTWMKQNEGKCVLIN